MSTRVVVIATEIGENRLRRLCSEFPQLRFEVAPDEASFAALAPEAEVIFARPIYPDALAKAEKLRWVQVWTAGVERWLRLGLHERGVRITNASGVHGTPISELILAMMLSFATGLNTLIRAQPTRGDGAVKAQVRRRKFELAEQTVCVIGLGGIGGALAQRCQALGMVVTGVRRSSTPHPYVDRLYPVSELHRALAGADHVALCLPLTPETTGLIGEAELRAMRPSAYIYNVGRGASIDADALNRALREGWIAGAGLDVTYPEPLPPDSPLWEADNVILSQHTSGTSPRNADRIVDLFTENLRRYLDGAPLCNEIDLEQRY